MFSCSGGSSNGVDVDKEDEIAPAIVTDLTVIDFTANSVTLQWTATGDDTVSGTAAEYDMRYLTRPITWDNWDSAVQVSGEPVPKPAFSIETMVIDGLMEDTTYYFALKAYDEAGNWQGISNTAIVTCFDDFVITFADPALEAVVRTKIGKPTGDIHKSDLQPMHELYAEAAGITNLSGIEYCTNLQFLNLVNNSISDLSPLSGLHSLIDLNLMQNNISDIGDLAGLVELAALNLGDNSISDITSLAGLLKLERLSLHNNSISNITPITALTNLAELMLNSNSITDISALSALTNLHALHLSYNVFGSLAPLSGNTQMETLEFYNAGVSDLSPLAGMTQLRNLWCANNSASDINVVAAMTGLEVLIAGNNQITDISPLSGLSALRLIILPLNQISDVNPLSGLPAVELLHLQYNLISDIGPLVANSGLGDGDELKLESNPLSQQSIDTYIPALQTRGVDVTY